MDIEAPAATTTADSDDTKSNDSTASQPKHIQEMAKSTVTLKEVTSETVPPANDNATSNVEVPIPSNASQNPPIVPLSTENGPSPPVSATSQIPTEQKPNENVLPVPPQTTVTPQTVPTQSPHLAPNPIPASVSLPEISGPAPNVTVSQQGPMAPHMTQGMHIPPHAQYASYGARPFYMPPYGNAQYGNQYPGYYPPQQPYHYGPPIPPVSGPMPHAMEGHHYGQPITPAVSGPMPGPPNQQAPINPATIQQPSSAASPIPVSSAPVPVSASEEPPAEKNGSN